MQQSLDELEALPAGLREQVKRELASKLDFLTFAKFHYISALKGEGMAGLLKSVDEAYKAAMAKLPTRRKFT